MALIGLSLLIRWRWSPCISWPRQTCSWLCRLQELGEETWHVPSRAWVRPTAFPAHWEGEDTEILLVHRTSFTLGISMSLQHNINYNKGKPGISSCLQSSNINTIHTTPQQSTNLHSCIVFFQNILTETDSAPLWSVKHLSSWLLHSRIRRKLQLGLVGFYSADGEVLQVQQMFNAATSSAIVVSVSALERAEFGAIRTDCQSVCFLQQCSLAGIAITETTICHWRDRE